LANLIGALIDLASVALQLSAIAIYRKPHEFQLWEAGPLQGKVEISSCLAESLGAHG
jgi:hypothetical protein